MQSEEHKKGVGENCRKKCANCKSSRASEKQSMRERKRKREECVVLTYFHIFVHLSVCLLVGATLINIRICLTAELDNCPLPLPPCPPPPTPHLEFFVSLLHLLTRIRCIYMEFTEIFRALRKVIRVWVCEQNIHIQFESAIGYALLQWCREGTRMKSHQHFRSAVKRILNKNKIQISTALLSRKFNRPSSFDFTYWYHSVIICINR